MMSPFSTLHVLVGRPERLPERPPCGASPDYFDGAFRWHPRPLLSTHFPDRNQSGGMVLGRNQTGPSRSIERAPSALNLGVSRPPAPEVECHVDGLACVIPNDNSILLSGPDALGDE